MKHRKFLLVTIMALAIQSASAYDFKVDDIAYNKNSDGTSVTVTYINQGYYLNYSSLSGDINIPPSVAYSGTTYSVTSIDDFAFYSCKGITSVTIPGSVTSIGYQAFFGCRGLTSVIIPNSVTSIGNGAFGYCSGLTSVAIPNSVTSIGDGTFERCSGLKSVTIPGSVTSIGYEAFDGCTALASVALPSSVREIGTFAFYGCTGLARIDAYPNPEEISLGESVFYNVPIDGTLHVLPGYLEAYQNADQWKDFTNIAGDLDEPASGDDDDNENHNEYVTKYDVNGDGRVDVADVVTLAGIAMGM